MSDNKYQLPIKRIGNENEHKLAVLLCNPGGNPDLYKRLPEYVMRSDRVYKDAGMSLDIVTQYSEWFDDMLKVIAQHGLAPNDLLFLEYYPYHTVSSDGFNHKPETWDEYAQKALQENVEILHKCMATHVPIFGYYYGDWLRMVPDLKKYEPKCLSAKGWKKSKIKDLDKFLQKMAK